METVFTIIHALAAVFMIIVVLIQGGNSGGVGAAFGGGNSQGFFGASGATSFLGKLTYIFAGIFMTTSVVLSVLKGHDGKTGLTERIQTKSSEEAKSTSQKPEETKAPLAPTPAPK